MLESVVNDGAFGRFDARTELFFERPIADL